MLEKKRWIATGVLCSLAAAYPGSADELAKPTQSISQLQPANGPPVLLSPPVNAKPLNVGENAATIIAPASKLTPAISNPIVLSPVQPTPEVVTTAPPIDEFISLLSGTGLEGWVVHEGREDAWQRDGQTIHCSGAGGGWLRTEKEYSDFHLKFDYRLQAGSNSGLGIRCPDAGNPTFTGIELQLLDDSAPKYENLRPDQYTGSIYYHVAPTAKPNLKPASEWNSCEVHCVGDRLTVLINGDVVNEVNLAKPDKKTEESSSKTWKLAERPPLGHIALQSYSSIVEFRNLLIKDLAVQTKSGVRYVNLTDGDGEMISEPKNLTVHYVGQLLDGTRFGDTRDLGDPVTVPANAVIEGWKHGIEGMKVGGRRRLIVPPEMAYGSKGVSNLIPPGATLVFEVELCGFER